MKKQLKKPVKVLYETHSEELRTATNNKYISSPFLSQSEKVPEPYNGEGEEEEGEPIFENGELSGLKKIGVLDKLIKRLKLSFDYIVEEQEFEVYQICEKRTQPVPFYIYVNDGLYTYASYDMEYTEKFSSSSISEFKTYLQTLPFVKRGI